MTANHLIERAVKFHPANEENTHDAGLTWWQSVDLKSWRAYAQGNEIPAGASTPIQLLADLKGASHGEVGDYHYVVETDVLPKSEEEFNAWYDTEHLPGLARVPGVISAKRYLRSSGTPRYIACYELVSPAVMESKEWMAIRHTAWSSRVRPLFFNTVRQLYVRQK